MTTPQRRAAGPWRTGVALAALALAGCAGKPGVLFDGSGPAPAWPPPPDTARIRYVGELRTDQDLKPGKGAGRGLVELLLGKDPPRAMISPIGVCTDGASRVFVADSNAQAVHVFDLDTREYACWAPPEKQARLSQPVGVAYDPAGRLLVADSVAGVIFVFSAAGEFLGTMGQDLLRRPCGLAVDASGARVFVADSGAHQVVMFSLAGDELARIGSRGVGLGEFNFPTNVAIDRQGRLYVSDSLNFRVQAFSPDLRPLAQIGRKGDMPGYFSQPKGIAVDPDDHLYVVDANFEAVQLFNAEGQLLMSFGEEGSGPGQFWLPAGVCIDSSGRVFVADSYNRRVQVFQYLPETAGAEVPPP